MIEFKAKGDFKSTSGFLERLLELGGHGELDEYGRKGVIALQEATPKDTGKTASSWGYEITRDKTGTTIHWNNSNVVNGCNIAALIQYGHGTKNGGYVKGQDYINPAMKPVFDEISEGVWKEVSN